MNTSAFSSSEVLQFVCDFPISYGKRISIISQPARNNGEWIADAIMPNLEIKTLKLKNKDVIARNFIVVRCQRKEKDLFSCLAIPTVILEKSTENLEVEVIKLLRSTEM